MLLEQVAQGLLDQPRVGGHGVDAVDEQVQRRRFDAEVSVRRDVLQQLHGAAPQLAGREDFRGHGRQRKIGGENRSEEHTSELQSPMRISYAAFCLKKLKYRLNAK